MQSARFVLSYGVLSALLGLGCVQDADGSQGVVTDSGSPDARSPDATADALVADALVTGALCPNGESVPLDGGSGLAQCSQLSFNRAALPVCALRPQSVVDCLDDSPNPVCTTDADCADSANGTCINTLGSCGCKYGCEDDTGCGEGSACLCRLIVDTDVTVNSASLCLPAQCRGPEDCASGRCGLALDGSCMAPVGFFCRTPADDCTSDDDCGPELNAACLFDEQERRWRCLPGGGCTAE